MAENSKIEWTDHTANLWWGCTKVHAGCDNCYAEHLSDTRYLNNLWGEGKPRKKIKKTFSDLKKWQKSANGKPLRVFVGSMMDIFEKPKAVIDHKGNLMYGTTTGDLRDILFSEISAGQYSDLIFLLLTKRPSNINKYIPRRWLSAPPKNVFFGCSPVDQPTYENFSKHMSRVNGNKFYSIEPQLDSITLNEKEDIDWIIQGGESGHNKRPFNLEWAAWMRTQCKDKGIPYFFKQIDKVQAIPKNMLIRQFPKTM